MGKLDAALAWAARGFPVFPLVPNGKEPAFEGSWFDISTTDPDIIRSYWTDPVLKTERDYNIGMDCTDRIVIDIDIKPGKDGYNEYMQLVGADGWNTLTVRTPSGGYHLYFEGQDCSNAPISPSVDVRSHHGYVVAPGSVTDFIEGRQSAGTYEVVRDMEPAWVPHLVERLTTPSYSRRDVGVSAEDTDAKVQAAINYLSTTPVAVEGQRGDDVTFKTAAHVVRELGVSTHRAYELMAEYFNPRCDPPWSLDELLQKVENASLYGTADMGRLDALTLFRGVDIPAPPSVLAQANITSGNAIGARTMTPRRWLYNRLLLTGGVTAILAAGAVGKSSLALTLAAHGALGLDFGGYGCRHAVKSIVYNGEDDVEEQSRRLLAICMLYGFDYETVSQSVILLSEEEVELRLVTMTNNGASPNEMIISAIVDLAIANKVGLIVLDPLVDIHSVNEGDSTHMNIVMRTIKRVAKMADCAVLVMHHTTKGGTEKQEQRIGNMDISRGSSAIVYKSRVAFTLVTASQQDAETYGLQDGERKQWIRMDDAKMNLTLETENALWFKKHGVKIESGDVVGVLKHQDLQKNTTHLRMRVADLLINYMTSQNTAAIIILQAVAFVKATEPLFANRTDTEIRRKLDEFFGNALSVREHTLRIERGAKSTDKPLLVLS